MGYHATFEDVERAVEGSDYVTVDIKNVANAEALAGEGRVIAMGAGHLPKEFDEGLLGMNVNETKTISWTPRSRVPRRLPSRSPSRASRSASSPSSTMSSRRPTSASTVWTPCATL